MTYDEIDPEQAMLLVLVCFGGPATPARIELLRRLDRRRSDYFGLYAVEEVRAVSQVEVLHIDTETREGREKVAGIAGVATLPSHARRGLASALMRRAHELCRERGIRISFLLTSAALVAYEMYLKLGYSTLIPLPRGYKIVTPAPRSKRRARLRRFHVNDAGRLDDLFRQQTKDCLGFVHRQDGFISIVTKTKQISRDQLKVAVDEGKIVGYIWGEKAEDYASIYELVGSDGSVRGAMLEEFEQQTRAKSALCFGVTDPELFSLYQSRGYKMYQTGWGRVMAASVDGSLRRDEIADLYGTRENRFVIYSMDMF